MLGRNNKRICIHKWVQACMSPLVQSALLFSNGTNRHGLSLVTHCSVIKPFVNGKQHNLASSGVIY